MDGAVRFDALIETLRDRQRTMLEGGGAALVQRHRARGKIAVRDRIDLLLDAGSPFLELSPLAAYGLYNNELPSAGIVTGIGLVHDTPCMLIANDATVKGGSFFAETVRKQSAEDWTKEYSAEGVTAKNRFAIVLDCAAHADHHVGQIINLSRELSRESSAQSPPT